MKKTIMLFTLLAFCAAGVCAQNKKTTGLSQKDVQKMIVISADLELKEAEAYFENRVALAPVKDMYLSPKISREAFNTFKTWLKNLPSVNNPLFHKAAKEKSRYSAFKGNLPYSPIHLMTGEQFRKDVIGNKETLDYYFSLNPLNRRLSNGGRFDNIIAKNILFAYKFYQDGSNQAEYFTLSIIRGKFYLHITRDGGAGYLGDLYTSAYPQEILKFNESIMFFNVTKEFDFPASALNSLLN